MIRVCSWIFSFVTALAACFGDTVGRSLHESQSVPTIGATILRYAIWGAVMGAKLESNRIQHADSVPVLKAWSGGGMRLLTLTT